MDMLANVLLTSLTISFMEFGCWHLQISTTQNEGTDMENQGQYQYFKWQITNICVNEINKYQINNWTSAKYSPTSTSHQANLLI